VWFLILITPANCPGEPACSNNGICVSTATASAPFCRCDANWTGPAGQANDCSGTCPSFRHLTYSSRARSHSHIQCRCAATTARALPTAYAQQPIPECRTANAKRDGPSVSNSTALLVCSRSPSRTHAKPQISSADDGLLDCGDSCSVRQVSRIGRERVLEPRVMQPHIGSVFVCAWLARCRLFAHRLPRVPLESFDLCGAARLHFAHTPLSGLPTATTTGSAR
jgi:hypothetical protein